MEEWLADTQLKQLPEMEPSNASPSNHTSRHWTCPLQINSRLIMMATSSHIMEALVHDGLFVMIRAILRSLEVQNLNKQHHPLKLKVWRFYMLYKVLYAEATVKC